MYWVLIKEFFLKIVKGYYMLNFHINNLLILAIKYLNVIIYFYHLRFIFKFNVKF